MEREIDSEPLDFPATPAHYLPHQEKEAALGKFVHICTSKLVVPQVCPGPTAAATAGAWKKGHAQTPAQGCESDWGGLSVDALTNPSAASKANCSLRSAAVKPANHNWRFSSQTACSTSNHWDDSLRH